MPSVLPLRGLRYDPKHVGSLSPVIAPHSDQIDAAVRQSLYDRHPANVVRLELNREEPGDDARINRFTRAGRLFRAWREQGVLMQDTAAAIYVCHLAFELDGRPLVRRGVIARVRLERFGTGNIHPHEETMAGPREDHLRLLRARPANVSPVCGLYPDPAREVQGILDAEVAGQPPVEATDHLGVTSRMWPLADDAVAARVAGLLGPKPVFIADGHHRYEAACDYRDEIATTWAEEHGGQPLPSDHPANFVMMLLVGMSDPGLVPLPTHRLFVQPVVDTAADLCRRLGECFSTRTSWRGPAAVETVWANLELEDDQGTLAFYTAGDQCWTIARITPAGCRRMEALAAEHGSDWRDLGVSILHRLVISDLLGGGESIPTPGCVHRLDDMARELATGAWQLAALVMPVGVDEIRRISETGERLPASSTSFTPMVPAGLVINPLE